MILLLAFIGFMAGLGFLIAGLTGVVVALTIVCGLVLVLGLLAEHH